VDYGDEISILDRAMSRLLGDRLRTLRGGRGWSQERMGKLFGMTQSAYQRLESGRGHHTEPMLERIDRVLVDNGFAWRPGMAAELDRGDVTAAMLERLERIEGYMSALFKRLDQLGHDRELIEHLRAVLDDEDDPPVKG
jgi:transcriptional regulator with XRE-family HTH domain